MKNRRTLIAAVLGGGLLLGAAGIGIVYFVVFAGSSPQKLALSSPTPTTSGSASSSASTAGAGTWTVTSGSQAGYRVREQLASLPAPSDAVGRTSAVTGTLTLAQAASGYSVTVANFSVDVSKLTSDQSRRDQRIHLVLRERRIDSFDARHAPVLRQRLQVFLARQRPLLLGLLEQVLSEVRHLAISILFVELDDIGERARLYIR